jgi:HD-like signal output (HDOD) protein
MSTIPVPAQAARPWSNRSGPATKAGRISHNMTAVRIEKCSGRVADAQWSWESRGPSMPGLQSHVDLPKQWVVQMTSSAVREKLARCADLPSMPAVAIEILDLCQRDEPNMAEIAKLISSDPALSAKMLRLANSPMYGLMSEVRTISHAVCILGLAAVRPLALSFSLVKGLQAKDKKALTWFWKRSLLSAVAARELSQAIGYRLGEEAFMGALLQDIGVLALGQLAIPGYEALAKDGALHVVLAEGEREIFGEDHAEIGAWLAARWRLPGALCAAIRFSHAPDHMPANLDPDTEILVRLVAVSGEVADVWIEQDPALAVQALRQSSTAFLSIDEHKLESALQRVAERAKEVATFFDVDLGSQEELSAILEQAKEALLVMAITANRQVSDAQQAIGSLEAKTKSLEQEASRDGLTGLYNRSFFDQALRHERDPVRRGSLQAHQRWPRASGGRQGSGGHRANAGRRLAPDRRGLPLWGRGIRLGVARRGRQGCRRGGGAAATAGPRDRVRHRQGDQPAGNGIGWMRIHESRSNRDLGGAAGKRGRRPLRRQTRRTQLRGGRASFFPGRGGSVANERSGRSEVARPFRGARPVCLGNRAGPWGEGSRGKGDQIIPHGHARLLARR